MAIGSPEGRLSPASFRSYQSAMEGLESEVEPGSQDDDEDHDDAGPIDDSDSEQSDSEPEKPRRRGTFLPAPTLEQVEDAARDLQDTLKPPRTDTTRHYKDPSLDKKSQKHLEDMRTFCLNFIRLEKNKQASGTDSRKNSWTAASVETILLY
jgi:hypothetical protein